MLASEIRYGYPASMHLAEAYEKAQRILVEEQSKPTLHYKYAGEDASSPTASLMAAAARMELNSERPERPRKVYENTREFKFESLNFNLLVRIFNQVMEAERPQFIGGVLKFVEKPFPGQSVADIDAGTGTGGRAAGGLGYH